MTVSPAFNYAGRSGAGGAAPRLQDEIGELRRAGEPGPGTGSAVQEGEQGAVRTREVRDGLSHAGTCLGGRAGITK